MATATITSKGQTTIPKSVRQRLRLKAGDRVEFVLRDDGTALMVPATVRVAELEGILSPPRKPVTVAAMNAAIRQRGGRP